MLSEMLTRNIPILLLEEEYCQQFVKKLAGVKNVKTFNIISWISIQGVSVECGQSVMRKWKAESWMINIKSNEESAILTYRCVEYKYVYIAGYVYLLPHFPFQTIKYSQQL